MKYAEFDPPQVLGISHCSSYVSITNLTLKKIQYVNLYVNYISNKTVLDAVKKVKENPEKFNNYDQDTE